MSITLAKAFVLRKRCEKKLSELAINNSTIITYEDTENNTILDFDAMEYYNKYCEYTDAMSYLNTAITIANASNPYNRDNCPKFVLTQIEALKSRKRIVERFATVLAGFIPTKKEWDSHEYNEDTAALGKYVIKQYKTVTNAQQVADELPIIVKKIQNLEDHLSELNHTIKVELPEEVEHFLIEENIL